MLKQVTLPGWEGLTSSPVSEDGSTPLTSPDGEMSQSGPEAAPASLSPLQAKAKGQMTLGICGLNSYDSSPSAVLQSSLESRLQVRLAEYGSPEYALTWKHWDMLSGPPICALRASARRTSANASSGWPTPDASLFGSSDMEQMMARRKALQEKYGNNGFGLTLEQAAKLRGWPTPTEDDSSNSTRDSGQYQSLTRTVIQGWGPPTSRDHKDLRPAKAPTNGLLGRQVWDRTTRNGVLNPAFPRWLMGFPVRWDETSPHFEAWLRMQDEIGQADSRGTGTP